MCNHVKLGVFSKGTVLWWMLVMGLTYLWEIEDLHCRKVESTKWLKYKLCHVVNSLNKPMADLGFLFL